MEAFTVSVRNRAYVAVTPPDGLVLTPTGWGATTQGGWDSAEIEVTGPERGLHSLRSWLRYGIEIHGVGGLLWAGRVEEISLRLGSVTVTVSSERLFNAVNVIYSYTGDDGGGETGLTGWLLDDNSIGEFGRKDALHSAGGEMTPEQAEAMRQTVLAACVKAGGPDIAVDGSGGESGATLYCRGMFSSLDDRYYEDTAGYEAHEETGGGRVLLGWAVTGTTIGFVPYPRNRIYDMDGNLTALDEGDQVKVAGSTSNNGIKVIKNPVGGETDAYTAATISFDPTDDINDSAQGLGFVRQNEVVRVTGSPSNDGYYYIGDVARHERIEADGGYGALPIVSDSAGPTVTIDMAHNVETETALASETPGATVTLTALGVRISQQFEAITAPWAAGEIAIHIAKHGAPTDDVIVELYSSASNFPNALLASGTLDSAEIPAEAPAWRSVQLDALVTLNIGTKYHVVVRRDGSSSDSNYYSVSIDTDAGYTRGDLRLWDGAAWQTRDTAAHMAFKVWALMDATLKISEIVTGIGGEISGVFAPVLAGVKTRKIREGRSTAGEEIRQLMQIGNSSGARMQVSVTPANTLLVDYESASLTLPLTWQRDGRLKRSDGSVYPAGMLPVGRWVDIEQLLESDWQAETTRILVGAARYDARSQTWQLDKVGARDPFDVGPQQG